MKNYLVKSYFKIKDPDWKVVDRSHESDLYDKYTTMHNISVASFNRHLLGNWELKFFGGECDHINQAFEKTFWAIHDLWHSEPCNILYTDPDTVALKPFMPWTGYQNFMMFNYTDPRSFDKLNPYNQKFDNFFNAGVRYFPATMSKDTWKLGTDMAANWDTATYDTEQIILNAMLWSQGMPLHEVLDPTVAWQGFNLVQDYCTTWNQCPIDHARIVHLHSSRGADSRVAFMQNLAKQAGVKI